MFGRVAASVVLGLGLFSTAAQAQLIRPAEFQRGDIPTLPLQSVEVGGGEVLIEATIDRNGEVTTVRPLRETATFTERVIEALGTWRFIPARGPLDPATARPGDPLVRPIESKMLVAAVFRAPSILSPTLGEPVRDVAAPSNEIPYPTSIVTPTFPPTALHPGVVLVEVEVNTVGVVTNAVVRLSAPAFDQAALDAARQWRFRLPTMAFSGTPTIAFIIFGFPVPIT